MWEEVKGLQLLDRVSGFVEEGEVPHLSRRVTGDVDHATGAEFG